VEGEDKPWWKVEDKQDNYLADLEAWDHIASNELPD